MRIYSDSYKKIKRHLDELIRGFGGEMWPLHVYIFPGWRTGIGIRFGIWTEQRSSKRGFLSAEMRRLRTVSPVWSFWSRRCKMTCDAHTNTQEWHTLFSADAEYTLSLSHTHMQTTSVWHQCFEWHLVSGLLKMLHKRVMGDSVKSWIIHVARGKNKALLLLFVNKKTQLMREPLFTACLSYFLSILSGKLCRLYRIRL